MAGETSNSGQKGGREQLNSPESWEVARLLAAQMGNFPSSFTSVIRALRANEEQNKASGSKGLSRATQYMVSRLLKSDSMKAPVYFAALTYQPDRIATLPHVTYKDLLPLFSPGEYASIIGLVYLTRIAKKLCPPDEWDNVAKNLFELTDLGGHVGMAISTIGLSEGMLVGALRTISFPLLQKRDQKIFKEYRRALKSDGGMYNLEKEYGYYNCTHLQIASILLQSIGFGVQVADAIARGITALSINELEDKNAMKFKITEIWSNALLATGKEPNMGHRAEFYPTKAALGTLIDRAEPISSSGSPWQWLGRGKDDITPETTPQLFAQDEQPVAPEPDAVSGADAEAADEVAADLEEVED